MRLIFFQTTSTTTIPPIRQIRLIKPLIDCLSSIQNFIGRRENKLTNFQSQAPSTEITGFPFVDYRLSIPIDKETPPKKKNK